MLYSLGRSAHEAWDQLPTYLNSVWISPKGPGHPVFLVRDGVCFRACAVLRKLQPAEDLSDLWGFNAAASVGMG